MSRSNSPPRRAVRQATGPREGSSALVTTIFVEAQSKLLRRARFLAGREEAEDVVSEVFLRFWHNRSRFDSEASCTKLMNWLHTVLRNCCVDRQRAAHNDVYDDRILEALPDRSPTAEENVIADQRQKDLVRLIATLPERYQLALSLVDLYDFTTQDAADYLRISPHTLRRQLQEARRKLHEAILRSASPADFLWAWAQVDRNRLP